MPDEAPRRAFPDLSTFAPFSSAELIGAPALDLAAEIQRQMVAKLAQGIPVTLTDRGKPLVTYYPDGTSELHPDWYHRRY